jgi:hypothetical protein
MLTRVLIRLGGGAGAAILALAFVLPAGAAGATATQSCKQEPNGWAYTCVNVSGSGNYISTMVGTVTNVSNTTQNKVHLELSGPDGLIKNCKQTSVPGGYGHISCTWSPHANEEAGNYCATTWQYVSGVGYVSRGSPCVSH